MISRILTLILLLLAIPVHAAAQPTPPDIELTPRDIELERQRAIARGLPPRPPLPPPPAPPAGMPIDPADRAGILMAAAAYVRDVQISTARDSIFFDESFHPWGGTTPREPNLPSAISAEERQLLQRELRGGPTTRDRMVTNCQPLRGCELTVPHFIVFSAPVLRQDGTVTIGVGRLQRMTGARRPTFITGTELVLTRMGTTWTVTHTYGGYAT